MTDLKKNVLREEEYLFCDRCYDTIDFYISRSCNLSRRFKKEKEKKKKYKIGFRKYLDKFKLLDFEHQELIANHEVLKEMYEKCQNELNVSKQSVYQAEQEIRKLNFDDKKLKNDNEEMTRRLEALNETNKPEVNLIDFETTTIIRNIITTETHINVHCNNIKDVEKLIMDLEPTTADESNLKNFI